MARMYRTMTSTQVSQTTTQLPQDGEERKRTAYVFFSLYPCTSMEEAKTKSMQLVDKDLSYLVYGCDHNMFLPQEERLAYFAASDEHKIKSQLQSWTMHSFQKGYTTHPSFFIAVEVDAMRPAFAKRYYKTTAPDFVDAATDPYLHDQYYVCFPEYRLVGQTRYREVSLEDMFVNGTFSWPGEFPDFETVSKHPWNTLVGSDNNNKNKAMLVGILPNEGGARPPSFVFEPLSAPRPCHPGKVEEGQQQGDTGAASRTRIKMPLIFFNISF